MRKPVVFIPPLGTKLVLTQDWHFDLPGDHRNSTMLRLMHPKQPMNYFDKAIVEGNMLPAGTELTVRTIDIRQGQRSYEIIAFSVKIGKKPATRFFVRLDCANKIVADVDGKPAPPENNAAVAAILYANSDEVDDEHDGMHFLRLWTEGEFDKLRRNWSNIPDEVFIGADPLFKK